MTKQEKILEGLVSPQEFPTSMDVNHWRVRNRWWIRPKQRLELKWISFKYNVLGWKRKTSKEIEDDINRKARIRTKWLKLMKYLRII